MLHAALSADRFTRIANTGRSLRSAPKLDGIYIEFEIRLEKVYWTKVSGFDYDAFVKLLEQGVIYVDLRIGQYHTEPNKEKTHDYGTAFRIREINQPLLFKVKRRVV